MGTPSSVALRRRADALFAGPRGPAHEDTGLRGAGTSLPPSLVPRLAPGAGAGAGPGAGPGAAVGRLPADAVGVAAADVDIGPGARQRVVLAVRERLPLWMQLRCGLEPRPLAAMAVVLVAAVVFAAQHYWSGRPETVRAPELLQQGAATPGPRPPSSADPVSGRRVVVDVSGKVRRPGVLRLPAGSRVADALRAAGGATPGADMTGLNRARVLMDGEQVVVGVPATPMTGSGQAGAQPTGPLSLNAATAEQLDSLPGVGPVLAQHIVDYRTQHGGFRSVDELHEVDGIGDRRFADLQTLVRP